MKVAFITDVIYPHVKGGAEKRIFEVTRRLSGEHDVTVYCMRYWIGGRGQVDAGIRHFGVCKPIHLYTRGGRRRIWEAIYFALRLTHHLLLGKYDLIDCSQFPYFPIFTARVACWVKRKPLVVTWHEVWGSYFREYLGALGFFGELVEWLASKLPDRIVAVSGKTKRDLIRLGVPAEKIRVIPNGVVAGDVEAAPPSAEGFDVVYAGRLVSHKNVDLLLDAVSKLDNVSALIVGDGPEKEKLVGLSEDLGIRDRVVFRDFVDSSELYGILKSCRVFVLPSIREGFGIGVVEANAAGIPVVTVKHKNNAAVDLIENGVNGFVAEFNAGSVAAKINEVLGRGAGHYSRACKSKAAAFDWDVIANDVRILHAEVSGVA